MTYLLANSEQVRIQTVQQGRKQYKPFALERGKVQCANPEPSWSNSRGPPLQRAEQAHELESKEFFRRNPHCKYIKGVAPGFYLVKLVFEYFKVYRVCVLGVRSSTKKQNNSFR